MPRRSWTPILAAAATLAALVLPAIAQSAQATPLPAALSWSSCGDKAPAALQCAELPVPLDDADPTGPQIMIGLNRLPAADSAQRIGSLVFDPGGPGGAGTDVVALAARGAPIFSPALRQRFDLIGFDPRGVGRSTPIRCDPAVWNEPVSLFPRDAAGFARLLAHNQALGESCARLTGPLLGHVDTMSAARDIEAVRLALGEGKLNFFGVSYGSMLGAAYAEQFPGNIRTMALDGALDHAMPPAGMLADEARAYEDGLDRFFAWCDATMACALHGQDAARFFDHLVAGADAKPIAAPGCVKSGACRPTVTGEDIRLNVQQRFILFRAPLPTLGIGGWPALADALAAAGKGDASALSTRRAIGDHDPAYARLAISCLDWPAMDADFDVVAGRELLGRAVAPHGLGATQTWTIQAGCIGWPAPMVNPPHPADVRGAPPILIVNATHDPSTAYVWAHELHDEIAGSLLLTRNGDGHTSALSPGRTRDAIDRYLISGETPPPNTVDPD
jgi:pimeloyl-ACP methyl ester carboxylesterase